MINVSYITSLLNKNPLFQLFLHFRIRFSWNFGFVKTKITIVFASYIFSTVIVSRFEEGITKYHLHKKKKKTFLFFNENILNYNEYII